MLPLSQTPSPLEIFRRYTVMAMAEIYTILFNKN